MSYCMARSCCCRTWEVRLAVRYRSDLHSGDPIRWSKGHENRWWMDLGDHLLKEHLSHWLMDRANRWLMAKNHCQIRLSIRCLNRFAND